MSTFCNDTAPIWRFFGEIIYVIRIVIPVIIILLGTIDLGKAVIAGEDKAIKESQKMFIKRLIYGIAIFFITTIIKVVFGLLDVDIDKNYNKTCWNCATKPHSEECLKYADKENDEDKTDSDKEEDKEGEDEDKNSKL